MSLRHIVLCHPIIAPRALQKHLMTNLVKITQKIMPLRLLREKSNRIENYSPAKVVSYELLMIFLKVSNYKLFKL